MANWTQDESARADYDLDDMIDGRWGFPVKKHDIQMGRGADIFDADRIAKFKNGAELWQGTYPPTGDTLRKLGFDMVVLAAEEYQPESDRFVGVKVIHAPNDDAPISEGGDTSLALRVSAETAQALRDGKKVLSTCAAGLNRSGLVSSFTLMRLFPSKTGDEIIEMIRKARGGWAMSNGDFAKVVRKMQARRQQAALARRSTRGSKK